MASTFGRKELFRKLKTSAAKGLCTYYVHPLEGWVGSSSKYILHTPRVYLNDKAYVVKSRPLLDMFLESLNMKQWKMYLKPQGQRGTCVFLTTQIINIFLFFIQYQYQYQYQNSQKVQYQYQNQYFGYANFNINIKINILKL